MKKVVVILLVVCLALPLTTIADVSLPDFTDYTTEDLIALKTMIDQEMLDRGIENRQQFLLESTLLVLTFLPEHIL